MTLIFIDGRVTIELKSNCDTKLEIQVYIIMWVVYVIYLSKNTLEMGIYM